MSKKVGEKIRQLRAVSGLSQDNVADEIGMSPGNYGKIERGEIDINSKHLIKIAQVLKVNVAHFFAENQTLAEPETKIGYVTKDDLAQLNREIIKILKSEINQLRKELSISKDSYKPKPRVKKKK